MATVATSNWRGILHFVLVAALVFAGISPASAAETITFFHNDIAGTPVLATDVNGILVWKETYRPYGDRLVDSAASENNEIWFAGRPYDESTGLSYMGTRYYDPTLGRFMGVDPLGVVAENLHSFNRYAYANNNPYRFKDPDGRAAVLVWPIAIGIKELVVIGTAAVVGTGAGIVISETSKPKPGEASELTPSSGTETSGIAGTPPDPDDDGDGNSGEQKELRYESIRKHEKGGWGTEMDLDAKTAQRVLNNSVESGGNRYNISGGKLYEFRSDNGGLWHGYPIRGNEAPTSALRQLRDRGDITGAQYKRLVKGK